MIIIKKFYTCNDFTEPTRLAKSCLSVETIQKFTAFYKTKRDTSL